MRLGLGLGLPYRGRAGAGAFTPASLFAASEAGAWYDPSDLSTLWQDTGGTVAVTADGDSVARIDDKSGNGNNATQGTASKRPVYKTDGSLHWLLFDGVDDAMQTAVFAAALAQPITASLGGYIDSGGTTAQRFFDGRSAPGADRVLIGKQTASSIAVFAGTLLSETGLTFPIGPDVWSGLFNGASSVHRRNGTTRASGNAGTNAMGGITLGDRFDAASAEPLTGRIYNFILVEGDKSAEWADIEGYNADKAGVAL